MSGIAMPDVIVLLPGILGSVLQKDGHDVWAASGGAALSGLLSRGHSLRDLAIREETGADDLGDGITAPRLMPDVHLLPGLWRIDGYGRIRQQLFERYDLTEGQNYHEFPYDWRRDNRVSARQLKRQAGDWLREWRATPGHADAKLILVAHSMGGLVARYYLEALEGWRDAKALISFGTPYRGALNALDTLVNGSKKGPFGLLDLSAFSRSLPSVYQLLPLYPCYDPGNGALQRVGETTGIPHVDAARAAAALAFHHEIIDRVEQNRRDVAYLSNGYKVFPIVGDEQPTNQMARRDGDDVTFLQTYPDEHGEPHDDRGDGTVPRVSATPLEHSDNPRDMYAAARHASLQNSDSVLSHLSGVIGTLYVNLGRYRAPTEPRVTLGLDVGDCFVAGEAVPLRVRRDVGGLALTAEVLDIDASVPVAQSALREEDGWYVSEFGSLSAGAYRVVVSGADARVSPVADVFVVLDRA